MDLAPFAASRVPAVSMQHVECKHHQFMPMAHAMQMQPYEVGNAPGLG
jgi:hypothetical protein